MVTEDESRSREAEVEDGPANHDPHVRQGFLFDKQAVASQVAAYPARPMWRLATLAALLFATFGGVRTAVPSPYGVLRADAPKTSQAPERAAPERLAVQRVLWFNRRHRRQSADHLPQALASLAIPQTTHQPTLFRVDGVHYWSALYLPVPRARQRWRCARARLLNNLFLT